MTSARCSGFEIPANVIAVPGIYWRGFARNLLSSSKVHFPPLAFIAAEKLKPPRPSPRSLPTIFQRLGPTRLGPPFSNVWQAAHCLAVACPFSIDAFARRVSIGCSGSFAAPAFSPALSSLTAISNPGLAGFSGANSAPAPILSASRIRQVPRTAPRILFSSKEFIEFRLPKRGVTVRSGYRQGPDGGDEIPVCLASGNPYKRLRHFRPRSLAPRHLAPRCPIRSFSFPHASHRLDCPASHWRTCTAPR